MYMGNLKKKKYPFVLFSTSLCFFKLLFYIIKKNINALMKNEKKIINFFLLRKNISLIRIYAFKY